MSVKLLTLYCASTYAKSSLAEPRVLQNTKKHIMYVVVTGASLPRVTNECGIFHMASLLLTTLPGAATATLCSETLLPAFQSQLPPVLAIILVPEL